MSQMIQVGHHLPQVQFQRLTDNGVVQLSTQDIFALDTVVLVAVPGAFTPTCSAAHLPGYVQHAEQLFALGVDRILFTAVNDAYVLDAWGKQQHASGIQFIADGGAQFAKALGVATDTADFGGIRSLRYSMLVVDGVVQIFNLDAPKTFEQSKAEVMVAQLQARQ